MCGRYYIEIEEKELRSIVTAVEQKTAVKTGEVFPTNLAPVLAPDGSFSAMRWGFPKFDGKGEIINARSETAGVKPTFRRPLMEGRCLVPASYYFEWEKRGTQKVKYALKPQGGETVWMAGLSRTDSKSGETCFVILTRPAWSDISFIHDRMPVILPRNLHDEWLNGNDPDGTMERSITEVSYKAV